MLDNTSSFLPWIIRIGVEDGLELGGGSLILCGFLSKLAGTMTLTLQPVGRGALAR